MWCGALRLGLNPTTDLSSPVAAPQPSTSHHPPYVWDADRYRSNSYPTPHSQPQRRAHPSPPGQSGSRWPCVRRHNPPRVGLTFPRHSFMIRFSRSGRFSWCLRHLRQRSATTTIAFQHPSRTRRQPRITHKGLVRPTYHPTTVRILRHRTQLSKEKKDIHADKADGMRLKSQQASKESGLHHLPGPH